MNRLTFLTSVVTKLCKTNNITIDETEESEHDGDMDTNSEDEVIPPTPLFDRSRVLSLNDEELTRINLKRGNQNGKPTFKRAEERRGRRLDRKPSNSQHPSKIPKTS